MRRRRFGQAGTIGNLSRYRRPRPLPQPGDDRRRRDDVAALEYREPPHQVFQLADISGPAVPAQRRDRIAVQRLARQAFLRRRFEEMPRQRRHVLGPGAQRRQHQRHDVDAII